jgi:hypothetical protein
MEQLGFTVKLAYFNHTKGRFSEELPLRAAIESACKQMSDVSLVSLDELTEAEDSVGSWLLKCNAAVFHGTKVLGPNRTSVGDLLDPSLLSQNGFICVMVSSERQSKAHRRIELGGSPLGTRYILYLRRGVRELLLTEDQADSVKSWHRLLRTILNCRAIEAYFAGNDTVQGVALLREYFDEPKRTSHSGQIRSLCVLCKGYIVPLAAANRMSDAISEHSCIGKAEQLSGWREMVAEPAAREFVRESLWRVMGTEEEIQAQADELESINEHVATRAYWQAALGSGPASKDTIFSEWKNLKHDANWAKVEMLLDTVTAPGFAQLDPEFGPILVAEAFIELAKRLGVYSDES